MDSEDNVTALTDASAGGYGGMRREGKTEKFFNISAKKCNLFYFGKEDMNVRVARLCLENVQVHQLIQHVHFFVGKVPILGA